MQANVSSQRKTMTIVWFALLATVGIYVVIGYVLSAQREGASELTDSVLMVLGAMAVGSAALSFYLPKLLLANQDVRERIARVGRAAEAAPAEREARLEELAKVYFTPWVVGAALAESVAIFGLVAAFLSGSGDLMLPFALVSLAILLVKRPRVETLLPPAQR